MNPLTVALRGKGIRGVLKRVNTINQRYGSNPDRVTKALVEFGKILDQHSAGASFPVPGIVVERHPEVLQRLKEFNIEFALHGYTHIDHSLLSYEKQLEGLKRGQQVLRRHGQAGLGFRSPYLRYNEHTLRALTELGFLYDGSQGVAWQMDEEGEDDNEPYQRALSFYRAVSAAEHTALPRLQNGLVRIPYSLPDDEALVDRFMYDDPEPIARRWNDILFRSHQRGELFTLGLHPERIRNCGEAVSSVLAEARKMSPQVWIARQDEIARWWKDRASIPVAVQQEGKEFHLHAGELDGLVILVRSVEMLTPAEPWDREYRKAAGLDVRFVSDVRPFIGISNHSAASLEQFLREQGYIVERAQTGTEYSFYFDCPVFEPKEERQLLDNIEKSNLPLVRLGRWYNGSRSALSISGDIEGFTIWDYSLRFFGS